MKNAGESLFLFCVTHLTFQSKTNKINMHAQIAISFTTKKPKRELGHLTKALLLP
jgi:hypothetical protein